MSWEDILKISNEEAIQDANRYGDKEDIDPLTPAEKRAREIVAEMKKFE